MVDKVKKILVIRFSSLGDIVLTIPVLYNLYVSYPYLEITVLTKNEYKNIFNLIPGINIIGVDFKKEFKGLIGIFKLFLFLKKKSFNTIIDLHNVLRTWGLRLFFYRTPSVFISIKKNRFLKNKYLLNSKKIHMPNILEVYKVAFEKAGFFFKIKLDLGHLFDSHLINNDNVKQFICYNLNNKNKKIVICPFARYSEKIYPLNKMEYVVKQLSLKTEYTIILAGKGAEEELILKKWQAKYSNVITVFEFCLLEQIKIFSKCQCAVVMDSANLHISGLAGIKKIISIWGATNPKNGFNVWPNSIPIQSGIYCSPCSIFGNKKCKRKDLLCMQVISPKEILKTIYSA